MDDQIITPKSDEINYEAVASSEASSKEEPTAQGQSTSIESLTGTDSTDNISKRKRKKLLKLQKWESRKKILRVQEREKYRQKRQEAVSRGEPARTGPSRKELKKNKTDKSQNFITVAIDLSFDNLMIDKDISKCVQQLLRMYTMNRRSSMPIPLYFTGIKDGSRIEKTLQKHDGYRYWDVSMSFLYYDYLN